jgi:hypothetical protein
VHFTGAATQAVTFAAPPTPAVLHVYHPNGLTCSGVANWPKKGSGQAAVTSCTLAWRAATGWVYVAGVT